jgi:arylsulfatase A-like enzyme
VPRPNILFLVADQQKATSLPQYGNPDTKAPHLDALAARGVTVEYCYVQHPFCVPSRAAFLTGRYPQATGVHHNSHRVPQATSPQPADIEADALMTGAALAFLDGARQDAAQPFYLHVAWIAPHPPYYAPAPYATRYDPAGLQLPPAEPPGGHKPPIYRQTAADMGKLDAPEPELRSALAHYYGMCAYLDDQVGRLMTICAGTAWIGAR